MAYVFAVLVLVGAVALVVWQRRAHRDEMFAGITPGLLPAAGQPAVRVPVAARQAPPVAVRFDPPAGIRPALAGMIAEARVETVAVSATLVDLAARGWLTLSPIQPDGSPDERPKDWELRAADTPPQEQLSPVEEEVLRAAFAAGPVTTLHEFRARGAGLTAAFGALEAEARERNWFRSVTGNGAGLGAGAAVLGLFLFFLGQGVAGVALLLSGLVVLFGTRGLATPVTAEGYAARVQALGFKQYLATAEAEQLRFEVGIEQFSRYLPYAMVFGVVDHWRHVFAGALQAELDAGGDFSGFGWLAVNDALTTLVLVDLLTDGGLLDGFVSDFGGDPGGDWSDPGLEGGDAGFSDSGFDGGGFDGGFGD